MAASFEFINNATKNKEKSFCTILDEFQQHFTGEQYYVVRLETASGRIWTDTVSGKQLEFFRNNCRVE